LKERNIPEIKTNGTRFNAEEKFHVDKTREEYLTVGLAAVFSGWRSPEIADDNLKLCRRNILLFKVI
jgi:hypothetical protein